MFYIPDMAIWMSNFDNFDIDQKPSKFAQRQCFACNFYCIKIYIVCSLDNAENAKRNFLLTTLYQVSVVKIPVLRVKCVMSIGSNVKCQLTIVVWQVSFDKCQVSHVQCLIVAHEKKHCDWLTDLCCFGWWSLIHDPVWWWGCVWVCHKQTWPKSEMDRKKRRLAGVHC